MRNFKHFHLIELKKRLAIKFEYNKTNGACLFKKLRKQSQYLPARQPATFKKKEFALQKGTCLEKFNQLSIEDQKKIKDAASKDQFLRYLTEEDQIVSYMARLEK